ncbi:EAL domain-containing protein [Thalassotalea sp. M1531]|uniref:EAL domain-containing protein n=1 Tax=Thalassotalea algicola TaxID=2716224 RepID=A0A7Y0Q6B2_9GAMM|nr:EAL domain-containing protein [Thalassotalea algicola]NMP30996.1 EAL domain-containing protein [Thalassotalea algicola]
MDKHKKRRSSEEVVLMSMSAFASIVILPFACYRFMEQHWPSFFTDLALITGLLSVFICVYFTRKIKLAAWLAISIAVIGICLIVKFNGTFPIYWCYPVIIATYFLIKPTVAVFICLGMLSVLLALVMDILAFVDLFTFLATSLITIVFSYVFSKKTLHQHKKISHNAHVMQLRNQALEEIVHGSDLSGSLDNLCRNIEHGFAGMKCCVALVSADRKVIEVGAAPSMKDNFISAVAEQEIVLSLNPCAYAIKSKSRVVIEDIAQSHQWPQWRDICVLNGLGACWSEPILGSNGQVLGTFSFYHVAARKPTRKETALIIQVANLVSMAIERERSNHLIWHQANFDQLTNLPNRNMMQDHLKQSLAVANRERKQVAVAFLDLDHFKEVNDRLGHDIGDLFLIETAKRLKACLRATDDVARLGGDEFVVTMTNIDGYRDIEVITEHIVNALSTPYYLQNEIVHSSVSIGVTVYPDDGRDIDTLLKNADQAMYGAKHSGRNGCHFFTAAMRDVAEQRYQMLQDLRVALAQQQFMLYYQPIVCMKSQQIIKAEALLRWQHPDKGIIYPNDFISLAEETGLIVDIGNWVVEQVIEQLTDWQTQIHPEFQVSINTSPVQYRQGYHHLAQWTKKMRMKCLSSNALCLEITENLLMSDKIEVHQTLTQLQEVGLEIAIDDFGTGYSSFGYLKQYSADYLKIDQSFVNKITQDPKELALCEAIIVMAKKLGIKVIAEGIETLAQAQLLNKIGCDYAQGYYFAKPMTKDDFEAYISQKLLIEV